MRQLNARERLRKYYLQLLGNYASERSYIEIGKSAIVFAPHQDDETLGCGGTIIAKTDAGLDVAIVFMTDGRQSHSHLIGDDELILTRRQEAILASRALGVKEGNVHFLDFEDGRLIEHYKTAVQQVIDILHFHKPDEVFIPYHREFPSDHSATNEIVLAALDQYAQKTIVYEYPIWFWHHWPWVNVPKNKLSETLSVLKNTVVAGFGWQMVKDFECTAYIGDKLPRKRAALDQHKTQVTQFVPDSSWLTLQDVSNGEFLSCFFQDHELFQCYSYTSLEGKVRKSGQVVTTRTRNS